MANPYRSGLGTRVESGEGTMRSKGRGIIGSMPHPPDAHPNPTTGGGGNQPPGAGGIGGGINPGSNPGSGRGVGGQRFPTLGSDGEDLTQTSSPPKKPTGEGRGRRH